MFGVQVDCLTVIMPPFPRPFWLPGFLVYPVPCYSEAALKPVANIGLSKQVIMSSRVLFSDVLLRAVVH